jgi:hypothetical protein
MIAAGNQPPPEIAFANPDGTLAGGPAPPDEIPTLSPEDVKVIDAQVDEIFGPKKDGVPSGGGPAPAAQPDPGTSPRPASGGTSGARGAKPVKGGPTPVVPVKWGDPCPRCGIRLNAMLGCDACGWPGEELRS